MRSIKLIGAKYAANGTRDLLPTSSCPKSLVFFSTARNLSIRPEPCVLFGQSFLDFNQRNFLIQQFFINESFQRPFPSWGSESSARFQAHSKSELMLPSKCSAIEAIETQQRRLIILKNS